MRRFFDPKICRSSLRSATDEVEGATTLSHIRLFFGEFFSFYFLFLAFALLVCLLVSFCATGLGFYFWIRGARIGLTTDIGLLEEL